MKDILVLGGTQFIGRAIVEQLIQVPEYRITLFNRGKTAVDLFPDLELIRGDRETEAIGQIGQRHWDMVVDVSCYYPDSLQGVLDHLSAPPEHYLLISTCSVYDLEASPQPLKTEDAPLLTCSPEQAVDRSNATYGQRKAECDRILMASGLPHTILRPALVYGPHDHTDRLYYWLHQVQTQEQLLIPDRGQRQLSLTYVSDLATLTLRALQAPLPSSVYNAVSTPQASIRQIVDAACQHLDRQPEEWEASREFLQTQEVRQWSEMALWIDGDHFTYDNRRLREELEWEPTGLSEGIAASVEYAASLGWAEPKFGMKEERKRELIELL